MALPSVMRTFQIELADNDRSIYEQLDLRVAQHPSESERYLVARVIARALEHADGLEFSKGGVSDDEEPALIQRDLRGDLVAWIEIGSPSADRLHKASKASPRVAVYAWRSVDQMLDAIRERGVHRMHELELNALPEALLDEVAATLDRRNLWYLTRTDGELLLTIGDRALQGAVTRLQLS